MGLFYVPGRIWDVKIIGLKINGIRNPVGFSCERLFASWKVTDTAAKRQVNARIEVAKAPDFKGLAYRKEGQALCSGGTELELIVKPRTTYYWRVTVTGENGECAVSETAVFETGKLDEPWQAKWIGAGEEDMFYPVLKKEFAVEKKVVRGRIYICGLSQYDVYLNRKKIDTDYPAPCQNDDEKGYPYQTCNITSQLARENRVEILLGKGWCMGVSGSRMMAIAEMHLDYEDGSTEIIVTDESWQYRGSDIVGSGIHSETIDRLLWQGKENPWRAAEICEVPGKLLDRCSLPVVVKEELAPVEILHTPAGETVADFGQKLVGYMEFTADFEPGTRIMMECGKVLKQGNFCHDNHRGTEGAFTYVSDGRKETVRPHFTCFNYRYLCVSGWPGELKKEDITAKVVCPDLERTGYIETSNQKINRLYENCLWSQKSNFIYILADCLQRNEHLGQNRDVQVSVHAASHNMDTRAFYRKFLHDLRSARLRADGGIPDCIPLPGGAGGAAGAWGGAGTYILDKLFSVYGNLGECEEYYSMMQDWVEYMYRKDEEQGGMRLFHHDFRPENRPSPDGIAEQGFEGTADEDYIGTVCYYQSAKLIAEMAGRLGYSADARKYHRLEKEICGAIFGEYFTPSGRLAVDTQTAYSITLMFGPYLDRKKLVAQLKERLRKDSYQIRCGFVGVPLLCTILCENGMEELAYHFLFQEDFQGWLSCSFDHNACSFVTEFLYTCAGGIRAAEPGYRKALIAPVPDMRFRNFGCSYDSASGRYASNWDIAKNGMFTLQVEIPFGCEATVRLPRCSGRDVKVSCWNGKGIKYVPETFEIPGTGELTLDAGRYAFTYFPTKDFRQIYHPMTRLYELTEDKEVLKLLSRELPIVYGLVKSSDKEHRNIMLGELDTLSSLGLTPAMAEPVVQKIYGIRRWYI